MENNKRDYSDFFKPQDEGSSQQDTFQKEDKQDRPSYYYSYGPFKSSMNEEQPLTTTAKTDEETSTVEITAPRPVRPYYGYGSTPQTPANPSLAGQWDYSGAKKKSSFKSYVATFLAGALVVGSLMFASDKMNLFSGSAAMAPGNGSVPVGTAKSSGSGNGGATTAAFDNIVRPGNISDIVNSASPAVVKINTYVKAGNQRGGSLFDDDFFNFFFGDNGRRAPRNQAPNNGNQRQAAGMGSGFIFDKTGYILTNQHVVEGADEIEVEVQGYSKPFKAKLLGSEFSLDLAVLKIEGDKDFPFLKMGSSDDIRVGDWVVAIGNPYGFDHTVTVGVLSAKERPIKIPDRQGTRQYEHLLQTDASINPGNSGGPLLNLNGEVIGINTAVSAQAQGIGFAIPTSTVMSVLENLKNNVKIPIPYIGVGLSDIQKEWVKQLQLDNTDGAVITQVEDGSPAQRAGLTAGDVVIELNGSPIKNSQELSDKIKASKVGDKVTLKIVRDGKKMDTFVIVGDRNKGQ